MACQKGLPITSGSVDKRWFDSATNLLLWCGVPGPSGWWTFGVLNDSVLLKLPEDAPNGVSFNIASISYTHLTLPTILRV